MDGIRTLLFVNVYWLWWWWGGVVVDVLCRIGDDGGISSGVWRNGNVCQKDRNEIERNDRNKARYEWKSFDEEIKGGKKGFEIDNNSSEFGFSAWFAFIDDIGQNSDWSSVLTRLFDAKSRKILLNKF